ncbi:HAD family hydrolase [Deinococcus irradiatisoli]|uniref:HAD family hydrolase n=1 Tax=Deinococcus irradiatisoli TaxID=2202254 RepID=UPI001FE688DE|nr:HAD family hydrolase [Deinococcus irradiatisoli]
MTALPPRPLLVLDLDETLWHGRSDPALPGGLRLLLRPHLAEFLNAVGAAYDLAVWTAASEDWMREGLAQLKAVTGFDLEARAFFLWHRERCTFRRDAEGRYGFRKPVRKFKAGWIRGRYPLERILVLDDQAANYACGYGHLVPVRAWHGYDNDDELRRLAPYLLSIAGQPDLRRIEKRGWRG